MQKKEGARKNTTEKNTPDDSGERFKGQYQNRLQNQTSEKTIKSISRILLLIFNYFNNMV